MYLSSKSLNHYAGHTDSEKKAFFRANYWHVMRQSTYPLLGLIVVVLGNLLLLNIVHLENLWLQALVFGGSSGFIYFQFHCLGLDRLAKQKSRSL